MRARGVLSLALCLVSLLPPARVLGGESEFEGHPLAYWLGLLREIPKDARSASPDWRKAPWVLGKAGVVALPALITSLEDPHPEIRLRAVRPIVAMGSSASDAAPALTARLKDDDTHIRQWSAVALGQIGSAGAGAMPGLIEALKDPEPAVRQAAAAALGNFDDPAAIPPLEALAADSSAAVRRSARLALDRLKPAKP